MTQRPKPRRLVILGSTGSIGVNTLKVVRHLNQVAQNGRYVKVVGLGAGRRADLLIEQAREFGVAAVALADHTAAEKVRKALPQVQVFCGSRGASEMVDQSDATDLSAAVVGSAGLRATIRGIRNGMQIGLANKETLAAAGSIVAPLVARHQATLIPVDSEHSAIFQCLAGERSRGGVKRIVLTASGGPFRTVDMYELAEATVEQALQHPTWRMGRKITIDSATMMNKALEIVEAHWLFGLPPDKIDVIIHPQSVVHSFVEFEDHSILAQLGPPDMRTPIQYALTYPDRMVGCSRALDWSRLRSLTFDPPDHEKFPAISLAYQVIRTGGTAGTVFNAANEVAVSAFLRKQIRFGQIVQLVAEALASIDTEPVDSIDAVMAVDQKARAFVDDHVRKVAVLI